MEFFSRTIFAMMALLLAACSGLAGDVEIVSTLAPPPTPIPIVADTPEELGEAIFLARCASCHGETGLGDGPVMLEAGVAVPDFTNPETSANQTIDEWTTTIRLGRLENLMPPWQNSLSAEEIDAVADYTFNMWRNSDLAAAPLSDEQTDAPNDAIHSAALTDTQVTIDEALGTVSGTITMMTEGATLPESLSVGLHVLSQDNEQIAFNIQDFESETFQFEEVTIRSDYNYMVTVLHDEVVFTSETTSGFDTDLTLDVDIYNTTSDPTVLDFDLLLMMVNQEDDALVIQQFARLQNRTDTVYRGSEQVNELGYASAHFNLPDEAILLNGEQLRPRFQIVQDGNRTVVIDTKPIIPGEDPLIELMYALPVRNRQVPIRVPLNYDLIEQPEVLTNPVNVVNGGGFESTGVQEFDFGTFQRYYGEPVSAGDSVEFRVTAIGVENEGVTLITIIGVGLMVAGALVILLSVVVYVRAKRISTGDDLTREALLRTIAELDTQFHAGELEEVSYRKRREHLKQQLADLMKTD